MPRPRAVALEKLIALSPNPNLDAAVVLAVALGARRAHEVAEDVGAPLPSIWSALQRLIAADYVSHLPRLGMLMVSRKGQAAARACYCTRTHTFHPPVPGPDRAEAAHEFGGAA